MKIKVILLLILILSQSCTTSSILTVKSQVEGTPLIFVKKTELIRIDLDPIGSVGSQTAEILLEVFNNGSSTAVFDLVDRSEQVDASTLILLRETPKPDSVTNIGSVTLIEWKDISLEAGDTVEFQYYVNVQKSSPINLGQTWYLNNAVANLTNSRGMYFLNANVSDVVTLELNLKNELKPLLFDGRHVFQPIPFLLVISLSNKLFSNIFTDPPADSSSLFAENWYLNWFGFLTDNKTIKFRVSAQIASTDPWGQVQVNPITLQTSSDLSTLMEQLNSTTIDLNAQINILESTAESFSRIEDVLANNTDAVNSTLEFMNELKDSLFTQAEAINTTIDGVEQLTEAAVLVKQVLIVTGLAVNDTSQALGAIADAVQAQDELAKYSNLFLEQAIINLKDFAVQPRTKAFLALNPKLATLLGWGIGNATAAKEVIEVMIEGVEELPGLSQLAQHIYDVSDALESLANILEATSMSIEQAVEATESLADGQEILLESISQTTDTLNTTADLIQSLKNDLNSTVNMSRDNCQQFSAQIGVLGEEMTRLEGSLSAAERYSHPFLGMPEVQKTRNYPIFSVNVSKERLNESSWLIRNITMEQISGDDVELVIYKLFLFFNPIPTQIQVRIQDGSFQELTSLGLEYNSENGVLSSTPWLHLNNNTNLVVDWLGNPIEIHLQAEGEIEVYAEVDIGQVTEYTSISGFSRIVNLMNQPIVVTQSREWVSPQLPSVPQRKSWWENFRSTEFMVILFALSSIIGMAIGFARFKRKEKKEPQAVESRVLGQEIDPQQLITLLESLEKKLRKETEKKGQKY